jgi:hypothetical protein
MFLKPGLLPALFLAVSACAQTAVRPSLDWFFDEYVYGTELPHYVVVSDFQVGADGGPTSI